MSLKPLPYFLCFVAILTISFAEAISEDSTTREKIGSDLKVVGEILTALNDGILSINETIFRNFSATKEAVTDVAVNVTTGSFENLLAPLNDILTSLISSQEITQSMKWVALCFLVEKEDSAAFIANVTKNWTMCMLEAEEESSHDDIQNVFVIFGNLTNVTVSAQKELESCTLGDGPCLQQLSSHIDAVSENINSIVETIAAIISNSKTDVIGCNSVVPSQAYDFLTLFAVDFVRCITI